MLEPGRNETKVSRRDDDVHGIQERQKKNVKKTRILVELVILVGHGLRLQDSFVSLEAAYNVLVLLVSN